MHCFTKIIKSQGKGQLLLMSVHIYFSYKSMVNRFCLVKYDTKKSRRKKNGFSIKDNGTNSVIRFCVLNCFVSFRCSVNKGSQMSSETCCLIYPLPEFKAVLASS
jgi:hypothetical protein